MFTWVCPKCGAEVPPSESECPRCAAAQSGAEAPPAPQNNSATQVPEAAIAPPPGCAIPPKGLPGWVVALTVALGLGLIGVGAHLLVKRNERKPQAEAKASQPAVPGESRSAHPLAKYIELTGFRVTEDAKKNVKVTFLVVNHSLAELPALELNVELHPATAREEEAKVLCTFSVKVPPLGSLSSTEISAVAKTQLRAYELPDWQFLRAEYDIVSPKP